jgi:hypothetical protein
VRVDIGIGIENEEVGEEPGSIPMPIAIPIPIPGALFALRKWRLPEATRTSIPRSRSGDVRWAPVSGCGFQVI